MLERTIVKKFGSRVLDTVTQAELSGLLRGVVLGDKSLGCRKSSPVMANRMLVQLRRFLAYSKSQGWVAENALAVYNHSEYWPERVAAQQLWGRKLAEMRRATKRSRLRAG